MWLGKALACAKEGHNIVKRTLYYTNLPLFNDDDDNLYSSYFTKNLALQCNLTIDYIVSHYPVHE